MLGDATPPQPPRAPPPPPPLLPPPPPPPRPPLLPPPLSRPLPRNRQEKLRPDQARPRRRRGCPRPAQPRLGDPQGLRLRTTRWRTGKSRTSARSRTGSRDDELSNGVDLNRHRLRGGAGTGSGRCWEAWLLSGSRATGEAPRPAKRLNLHLGEGRRRPRDQEATGHSGAGSLGAGEARNRGRGACRSGSKGYAQRTTPALQRLTSRRSPPSARCRRARRRLWETFSGTWQKNSAPGRLTPRRKPSCGPRPTTSLGGCSGRLRGACRNTRPRRSAKPPSEIWCWGGSP